MLSDYVNNLGDVSSNMKTILIKDWSEVKELDAKEHIRLIKLAIIVGLPKNSTFQKMKQVYQIKGKQRKFIITHFEWLLTVVAAAG